ncbi:hypothetical protein WMF38_57335 [Sorangium sp. So ce118]
MKKFNGGNGATVCDACGTMLTDGGRTLRPHRVVGEPPGVRHYCNQQCIDASARGDEAKAEPIP